MPRVTIGLPVYNGERFLASAIDSILAQDFTDFELLIADNGSTDGTPYIAQAAARRDPRVAVHRAETNHGAAWNYNRLVDLARGVYFKWAAHDDMIRPRFLSACVEILDARPQLVLCYPKAADIDSAGCIIHHYELPAYATEARPSQRLWRVLRVPSPCFETFALIRRDALMRTRRIGAYARSDRALIVELALLGHFYEIPELLFWHREHGGRSISTYADYHMRNVWFDPTRAGRVTAPNWRLLTEYALAIARAPISLRERLWAIGPLLWAVKAGRKELKQDLVAIVKGRARAG